MSPPVQLEFPAEMTILSHKFFDQKLIFCVLLHRQPLSLVSRWMISTFVGKENRADILKDSSEIFAFILTFFHMIVLFISLIIIILKTLLELF